MTDENTDLRTIRETNKYLRSLIETPENTRDQFWLSGVVTYKYQSNMGHTYFSITHESYTIQCMLRNQFRDKSVYIVKGVMLDVLGTLTVYEKDAKLQFMVTDVRPVQLDSRSLDTQVLEKLEEEGLYPRLRKDLPLMPKHISLITSKHSEALPDFKHVYREQDGSAQIQVLDAFVQGEQAPKMIVQRIQEANYNKETDIIVLTRGGGRAEDLKVYNTYEVAKAVCESKIPVVTGIGHQRDETIADRVADDFAISPTDAAYKLAKLSTSESQETPQNAEKQSISAISIALIGIISLSLLGIVIFILLAQ